MSDQQTINEEDWQPVALNQLSSLPEALSEEQTMPAISILSSVAVQIKHVLKLTPFQLIGSEDRKQIREPQYWPFCSICYLYITRQDGRISKGTGWFAGPKLIVSAGHCIFDPDDGGGASSIFVVPAKNGSINPFGVLQAVAAVSHPNWNSGQNANYDIGFIFLDSSQTAEQVGWFDCAVVPDHLSKLPSVVDVVGYPDDNNKPSATMWKNSGSVEVTSPYLFQYQMDTSKGQSGAPVFFTSNKDSMQTRKRIVVAIHTNYENGSNGGVRITADIYARILSYNQSITRVAFE